MAQIYRKSALERISSPDKLDCMLTVSSPMSWLVIASLITVCTAVILWAVFGSFPETLSAQGIIVYPQGTNTIYTECGGVVEDISVKEGDSVSQGTPVAIIRNKAGQEVTVLSYQSGVVSSLLAAEGSEVMPLSELIRISPAAEGDTAAVLYIPVSAASTLECGMKAKLFPLSLNSDVYGGIDAEITNIDSYIASQQAIAEITGYDGQMAALFVQSGPVVAVTCELKTDSEGNYILSKKQGGIEINCGEIVNAEIIVSDSAPITKVFPALEEK